MQPYVHCSIYKSQDMETSIGRRMDKRDARTHAMEYYLAIKKEIPLFATTWMDLDSIMLTSQKDKYHIPIICGI